jgi:hypothetical protein
VREYDEWRRCGCCYTLARARKEKRGGGQDGWSEWSSVRQRAHMDRPLRPDVSGRSGHRPSPPVSSLHTAARARARREVRAWRKEEWSGVNGAGRGSDSLEGMAGQSERSHRPPLPVAGRHAMRLH